MDWIWAYVTGVILEGFTISMAFWVITFITLESTSLKGAFRAGFASEAIGNLPYLGGIGAMDPPTILTTLIGAGVFLHIILIIHNKN